MSGNWIATSGKPGEIPDKPTIGDLRSTKTKAQFEAACRAAKTLASEIEGTRAFERYPPLPPELQVGMSSSCSRLVSIP